MVDILVEIGLYQPEKKLSKMKDGTDDKAMQGHPFSGFLGSVVCLTCNLTYFTNDAVKKYWTSEKGWGHIGIVLSNTKLDVDNPSLREWCYLLIRNLTSWSPEIRKRLSELTKQDGVDPNDKESMKTYNALSKPMQEMFDKEKAKYDRGEEDAANLQKTLNENMREMLREQADDFM
mmetsp:Transcript_33506/g.51475  ORF Transcript_33506/g.51475 Transcript_33506/m.51475 type:complete len:176 (-) Transcript_33506:3-530(-)